MFKNRNITILGLALGLLFFGWNAAEQHFTAFYQEAGEANIAFRSLAILYGCIVIGSALAPTVVRLLGIKRSMVLGFITYCALVFGIVSKNTWVIYTLSALLGVGCGVFGVAQVEFLRKISNKDKRGQTTGAVNALRTVGGFSGIISVSLLLAKIPIEAIYLVLGGVMVVGTLLLTTLGEQTDEVTIQSSSITKDLRMLKDKRILLIAPFTIGAGFLLGLILGAVPVSIGEIYGLRYVGPITSTFHLTLAFAGFLSGKFSDRRGRFTTLYATAGLGIAGAATFLLTKNIVGLVLAMVLAGIFSAANGVVLPALVMDLFEEKTKEAQASLGILGIILGVVPSLILKEFISEQGLFYLTITICVVGIGLLKVLESKKISY